MHKIVAQFRGLVNNFGRFVKLSLAGSLPTPCHQLQVHVSEPDGQNRIGIEVYSLVNPDMMCAQVLTFFEEMVSLGNFTEGTYSVWVNGEFVDEFSLP